MSVLPMKRILIVALKKNRKPILETLQRRGLIELSVNRADDEVFGRQDTAGARSIFLKNANQAEQALAILAEHAPEEKGMLDSLAGRKEITVEEYEARTQLRDKSVALAGEIIALAKEHAENVAEIPKLEAQKISLEPWLGYDLPLSMTGTKSTTIFVGTLPGEHTLDSLYTAFAEYAPTVERRDAQIISASPQQTNIFVVCANEDAPAIQDALHKLNFAKPPMSNMNPTAQSQAIDEEIAGCNARIEQLHNKIAGYAARREELQFASDYFTMRAEKYEVISELEQSKRTFILEGYLPAKAAASVEKDLTEKYGAVVEVFDPAEDEDVPVLLQNCAFTKPVEGVVASYSLPGKGEIDPSFLVSLFYYVLFGMMLGDAGYGIIIALVCFIVLKKVPTMEAGLKRSLQLFMGCGISTAIWGFLFGSFFGDTINVVATTFFNRPDITLKPIWFEPLSNPMRMLGFCFGIGLIHLFTGLGVKLYELLKAGKVLDAIFDVVFWYMLVGGCVVLLLSMSMFTEMIALDWILPQSVGQIGSYVAIVGAVGIILTGGRSSRNWGKRIAKGLYSLYGITSYLSDVLSYSRLLALGLATSVIASVFNKMGSMGGSGILGLIMFILVFAVGQVLNILINLLGAYVHTNRLQYVEFFGKFYEGGGRPFTPFTENTKYFKVKEDITQ